MEWIHWARGVIGAKRTRTLYCTVFNKSRIYTVNWLLYSSLSPLEPSGHLCIARFNVLKQNFANRAYLFF
jgi:hypothetical protein